MSLISQIDSDLIVAIKNGHNLERDTLRMIKSNLKNKTIELGNELTDPEIVAVLQKEVKKRFEASELYNQAGKSDLAAQEMSESKIIQEYLPAQITEEQIRFEVKKYLAENPNKAGQIGIVIGEMNKKLAGQANGAVIARIVKELS